MPYPGLELEERNASSWSVAFMKLAAVERVWIFRGTLHASLWGKIPIKIKEIIIKLCRQLDEKYCI